MKLALKSPNWSFKALKKDKKIDAILGYFHLNGVMTPPIFGYDIGLPQSLGLYRLLSILTTIEAKQKGFLLHFSAGAAQFKRLRGAIGSCEYSSVYTEHLPIHKRLPWMLLSKIITKAAKPLLERFKL